MNNYHLSPTAFKEHVQEIIRFFKVYFSNPFEGIKKCPDWDLPTVIALQLIFGIILGAISDFLSIWIGNYTLLKGIIFFPISSLLAAPLGATFFYFLFLFLYNRQIPFLKLYTLVFLAHIPFLVIRIFSPQLAPIELIGFAITVVFLTVGFVENFYFSKKSMIKLFGIFFAVYFVFWVGVQIYESQKSNALKPKIEAIDKNFESFEGLENVDKIEEEIQKNF